MINRLVPAGIEVYFRAKEKVEPGEVARVKKGEYIPKSDLVRAPKADTFTSSRETSEKANTADSQGLKERNQKENSKKIDLNQS